MLLYYNTVHLYICYPQEGAKQRLSGGRGEKRRVEGRKEGTEEEEEEIQEKIRKRKE